MESSGTLHLALQDRIGNANVPCEGRERDPYGRRIATCYVRNTDFHAWMVRQG